MKAIRKHILTIALLVAALVILTVPALAAGAEGAGDPAITAAADATASSGKAMAAGIAIGLAAAGGAVGMGLAIAKSVDGISRQPEAEGKIRTTLMLGLVFVETAIIYALVVAILIIFVL